jgi:hypothetical protein
VDAAAFARTQDLGKARRLAAEADGHLGMAERALNGLHYVPRFAPFRRHARGALAGGYGGPPCAAPEADCLARDDDDG